MIRLRTDHCEPCGGHRRFRRREPSHALHFCLTAVTLGIWVLPWAVLTIISMRRPFRCTRCGHRLVTMKSDTSEMLTALVSTPEV